MGDVMGMKEIETDANALTMAHHIDFCREINIFARVTRLIEPGSSIGSSEIAANEKVIKDRVNIDLNSDYKLGEEMQDHTIDTNGSGGNVEEDTHNGLIERCGELDGGIVEEERGTRSNLVEKADGLHTGDAIEEELENQIQDQGEVAEDSGLRESDYNFSSKEDELEESSGEAQDDEINA